jgi:hypothetical protein
MNIYHIGTRLGIMAGFLHGAWIPGDPKISKERVLRSLHDLHVLGDRHMRIRTCHSLFPSLAA